ncbi:NAD(P)/FAD-dependent oxidoreductase [Streptomyces sp. NPDC085524]|uniref:NAD(P)/FAD-dependent oxidoreductase n=1 Tax=Streptomyces sp. NPDC085524 TaxID=3365728 RepID=UPI0037CD0DCD
MTETTVTADDVRDVIVIGSGPAGYTAVLYTARAQLKPLLFGSSIFVGGSLTTTTEVENFPGFPDGIDGPDLMVNMRAQAEKFGAEMIDDDIVSVNLTGAIKEVTASEGTVHRAKTVIIATGSGYRKLGLPKEEELSGRGVSWCATCDGFLFRDRDIVAVGGGDTAMEEATFLTRFARSVTIVHRRSTLRASKVMQERAFTDDKISFAFDSEIAEIKETNGMLSGDGRPLPTAPIARTGVVTAHERKGACISGVAPMSREGPGRNPSLMPSTRTVAS